MLRILGFILGFVALVGPATAATYKCIQGGKSFYSDTPCAHDAKIADASSDQVTAAQRRQAHNVNYLNQSQLQEIARDEANARYQRQLQQRSVESSVQVNSETPRSRRGRRAPVSDE